MQPDQSSFKWEWKSFWTYHLVAVLLAASWIFPLTRSLWDTVDLYFFRFLNDPLYDSPIISYFWALANLKLAGWISVIFLILYFLMYVSDGKENEIPDRLAQFIYTSIWCEFGILASKQCVSLFLENLDLIRDSPTVVLKNSFMLSQVIPWLEVKDFSFSSFPSDHAVMALQWLGFICFFCPLQYRLPALFFAIVFTLPRLVGGAHWLSDITIGSGCLVCFTLAWATYSPIYSITMPYLVRLCRWIWAADKENSIDSSFE